MRLIPLKLATVALFIFSLSNYPKVAYSLPDTNGSKKKDSNALKGKEAILNVDPDLIKKFAPFFADKNIQKLSKQAHQLFESGAPGKIGYGFMMGYSSGFCLKKVSKIIAFVLGGVFITVQTLSYNGLLAVNYGKLQQEVESVLDFNKDGKVDEQDFTFAYDKVFHALSYHMPTGGGFTAGFLAGLRA